MSDQLHIGKIAPPDPSPKRTPFRLAVAAGAVAAFVLVAVLLLPSGILLNPWFHGDQSAGARRHVNSAGAQLLFGPAEQAYAGRIQIEKLAMSRAENFLHQEVTTLAGEVVNSGDRSLQGLELSVQFSDSMRQVVLRESRSVLDPPPLAPGGRRDFEISFEHVSSAWNLELPAVSVTALRFSDAK